MTLVKRSDLKRVPKFKIWLHKQGVTQDEIAKKTHLSVRTVHKLTNTGKANDSVILLIAYVLGLEEQELIDMIITPANQKYYEDRAIHNAEKEKLKAQERAIKAEIKAKKKLAR